MHASAALLLVVSLRNYGDTPLHACTPTKVLTIPLPAPPPTLLCCGMRPPVQYAVAMHQPETWGYVQFADVDGEWVRNAGQSEHAQRPALHAASC